jgi:hypothetical protein
MGYRRLTEAEREERRHADRQRVERAVRALLTSEGWQQWVRVRSTNGLARYSFGNQLLIAMQRPDATYVAGFRAFLALDRCVRKGERAIRILAPMAVRIRDERPGREESEPREEKDEKPETLTVFRGVSVFDVSQTDPLPGREPVPLEPPREPITGSSHRHLLASLQALAHELGYSVVYRSLSGSADGWCDYEEHEIVVNEDVSPNAQVRVLVHELAHAQGVSSKDFGRRKAEVLVDTVTYIVCGSVGLDVSGESIPYIAGWGEKDDTLAAIREYAEMIDKIARRIEDALAPATVHPAEQAVMSAS